MCRFLLLQLFTTCSCHDSFVVSFLLCLSPSILSLSLGGETSSLYWAVIERWLFTRGANVGHYITGMWPRGVRGVQLNPLNNACVCATRRAYELVEQLMQPYLWRLQLSSTRLVSHSFSLYIAMSSIK